jgi:hypothetical protein
MLALGVVVGWVSSAELQGDAKETAAAGSGKREADHPALTAACQYALLPSKVLDLFPVWRNLVLVRPPHRDCMFPSLLSHCEDRSTDMDAHE